MLESRRERERERDLSEILNKRELSRDAADSGDAKEEEERRNYGDLA